MPIPFCCPHCKAQTLVDDEFAGLRGPCFACQKEVIVPQPGAEPRLFIPPKKTVNSFGIILFAVLGVLAVFSLFCLTGYFFYAASSNTTTVSFVNQSACAANLKAIAAALQRYKVDHGEYPPAYLTDESGRPMLSWRVLILPQLGYQSLYDSIDLTEPWDGPSNQWQFQQMPPEFACPDDTNSYAINETNYMAIVGANTMFPGGRRVDAAKITDQLSDTIMVVETRGRSVNWAQPQDVVPGDLKQGIYGLVGNASGLHAGGVHVITADGEVRFLSSSTPSDYLEAMATINGGEIVPVDDFSEIE